MCAWRFPGAAVSVRHGRRSLASVGVSPPFFFVLSFVIAGLDPAIHAEVTLANAPTGICLLQLSMDHRVKPGGDESKSGVTVAWHSSDAQPHRENEILFRHCERSEAIQSAAPPWIASSLRSSQ